MFGGGVGGASRKPDRAQDRRHVDDGAAPGLDHGRDLVLHAEEHTGQIDVDDLRPAVQRIVGHRRSGPANTRVVAGHIEPAKWSTVRAPESDCLRVCRHPSSRRARHPPAPSPGRRFPRRRRADVGDDDLGALARPDQCDGAADARGRARDQRDFVLQHGFPLFS